jgi:hypothetical protein
VRVEGISMKAPSGQREKRKGRKGSTNSRGRMEKNTLKSVVYLILACCKVEKCTYMLLINHQNWGAELWDITRKLHVYSDGSE